MAYLNGEGLLYFARKLADVFVKKTQTVNGKPLSGNIVLKAADFANSVTNENNLASLKYTEPRENVIRVTGKAIAGENVSMSYGKTLNEVLYKGEITSNLESEAACIELNDGTYKLSVSSTSMFPIRYGTLFISTAGATYKMFLLVGTSGGIWYRVADYINNVWYDDWKHAVIMGEDVSGEYITLPYGKKLTEVLYKGEITSNPSSNEDLIGKDDGTYKVSLSSTTVFPIRYGTLFISTAGATYKMFLLVGTTGGLWYRVADYINNVWYDDWTKAATSNDIPSVTTSAYNPTFTWTGTSSGPTVNVNSCNYIRYGKMIQINCRFTITDLNAPSSATTLSISLPGGINAVTSAGILSELYHAGAASQDNFLIQCNNANALRVITGTGYGTVSDRLTAQTYGFSVIVFETN